MVMATYQAFTTLLGVPLVSAASARSRSATTRAAAPGSAGAVPAEPAVPAHRQKAAPVRKSGRGRQPFPGPGTVPPGVMDRSHIRDSRC
ncbi:hypothetical protein [Streptomyces sp. NBC_00162]|uniref:hypothetical protein n=1 Tax=Streptomyces sp. NBC_00162 TaxID=2903629 RepID=UPI00214B20C0|nr:hypothetical protein [Streptomyces sp. NBC_00162]UUU38022.1 hypothetical protein JIW86_03595 [Streptomyces sp. NBC_00162]